MGHRLEKTTVDIEATLKGGHTVKIVYFYDPIDVLTFMFTQNVITIPTIVELNDNYKAECRELSKKSDFLLNSRYSNYKAN
jgi:hypothetical protein